MIRLFLTLTKINNRQALRYPLQAVLRLLASIVFLLMFALAARSTSKADLAESLLATLIVFLSIVALTKTANLLESEAREEVFLYPYPIWKLQLVRAFSVSALSILGLVAVYGLLAGSLVQFGSAFLLIVFAYLGAVGLGLSLFALHLLFVKTDFLVNVVLIGVLTLAFLPMEKAPPWVEWVPLVNVVRVAQGFSGGDLGVLVANVAIVALGILLAGYAEREVVRRGIAGLA